MPSSGSRSSRWSYSCRAKPLQLAPTVRDCDSVQWEGRPRRLDVSVQNASDAQSVADRRWKDRAPGLAVRHTRGVATDRSSNTAVLPLSLADITVTEARDDLLLVKPLDLGPGGPATAALEVERGPQPAAVRERGIE